MVPKMSGTLAAFLHLPPAWEITNIRQTESRPTESGH